MPLGLKWTHRRDDKDLYKRNSSEYDHVAYQFIGNKAYSNMFANVLPSHLPLAPGVESSGHCFSFLKVVILHIK